MADLRVGRFACVESRILPITRSAWRASMVLSEGTRPGPRPPEEDSDGASNKLLAALVPAVLGDLLIRMEDGDGTGTCMQCGNVLYLRRGSQPPARAAKVSPAAA